MSTQPMLDFAGAQRQLGVSRATLVRWLRDGRITGCKAGKQWRFRSEDLNLILRDGQVAYGTQTSAESTRALVAAGLPLARGAGLTAHTWLAWQDAQQWLWISLSLHGDAAWLRAAREDTPAQAWQLSVAAARAVLQSWHVWRAGAGMAAPRPGVLTEVRGANGELRAVLCLPTHIDALARPDAADRTPATQARPRAAAVQAETWQVCGPACRATVAAAFHLARTRATQRRISPAEIVIAEAEPTYFWPGALHVYADARAGAQALPAQLRITNTDRPGPPQCPTLRTPAVSVAYHFETTHARTIRVLYNGRRHHSVALPR